MKMIDRFKDSEIPGFVRLPLKITLVRDSDLMK